MAPRHPDRLWAVFNGYIGGGRDCALVYASSAEEAITAAIPVLEAEAENGPYGYEPTYWGEEGNLYAEEILVPSVQSLV